jgi:hypothetical protein
MRSFIGWEGVDWIEVAQAGSYEYDMSFLAI